MPRLRFVHVSVCAYLHLPAHLPCAPPAVCPSVRLPDCSKKLARPVESQRSMALVPWRTGVAAKCWARETCYCARVDSTRCIASGAHEHRRANSMLRFFVAFRLGQAFVERRQGFVGVGHVAFPLDWFRLQLERARRSCDRLNRLLQNQPAWHSQLFCFTASRRWWLRRHPPTHSPLRGLRSLTTVVAFMTAQERGEVERSSLGPNASVATGKFVANRKFVARQEARPCGCKFVAKKTPIGATVANSWPHTHTHHTHTHRKFVAKKARETSVKETLTNKHAEGTKGRPFNSSCS